MTDKPTIQQVMDDLVDYLETLPYAEEHIQIWAESQITIACKEGTLVLSAAVQPSDLV
jgi:hypothetical protein